MSAPLVTAVIPTTGRAQLSQAVASVFQQSNATRVVVVEADPGHHDAICGQLRTLGGDVTLLAPGRRLSASAARNLGTDAVTTPFVAYLDDDDWWLPQKVEAQLAAMSAAGPETAICATSSYFGRTQADGDGETSLGRVVPVTPYTEGRVADYVLRRPRLRYGHHFLQTSSLMMSTDLARSVRWDERLSKHEDWDLVIRLIDRHGARYLHVPQALTVVRKGSSGSASRWLAPHDSLRWVDGIECSSHARNDFILSVVLRPAIAARNGEAVRTGLRAMRWTGGMSSTALAGLAGGMRRMDSEEH